MTGKYRRGEPLPPGSRLALRPDLGPALTDVVHTSVEAFSAHARERGVTPGTLALAWVMRDSATVRPLIGASRPAHLDAVAEAMAIRL